MFLHSSLLLPFSLFSGLLFACNTHSPPPQTGIQHTPSPQIGTHQEAVLYVGCLLYQKPVHSYEDKAMTPATVIIAALNADNGQKIWQRSLLNLSPKDLSRYAYTTSVTVDNALLYTVISTPVNGLVVGLDARTGRILWKDTEGAGGISSPIATNGVFSMEVGQPQTGMKTLRTLDGQSGKLLWSASAGDYTLGQIAATDKAVYLVQAKYTPASRLPYDSEIVRALRLNDGTPLWQKEFRNTPQTSLLPMRLQADSQAVYLFQLESKQAFTPPSIPVGVNTLLALRAEDGTPLWSVQTPYDYLQEPRISLVLVGHVLSLIGQKRLSSFNTQDGKLLSAYTSHFFLWTFLPNDHLYGIIGAKEANFCSFKSSDGTKLWCSNIAANSVVLALVNKDRLYLMQQQAIEVLKQNDGSQVGRYTIDNPTRVLMQSMAFSEEKL